jgi:hypothetical protein
MAFYVDGVQNSSIGVNSAGDLGINMTNNDNFVITTTGGVGIGNTAPTQKLDVENGTGGVTNAKFGQAYPVYMVSSNPIVGFNAYYDSG